jgi:dihydrofolate synthase/folylpolyglutamate synthase
MAFEYFYQQKVDFAIIEVGLGGRLDSTNIIKP